MAGAGHQKVMAGVPSRLVVGLGPCGRHAMRISAVLALNHASTGLARLSRRGFAPLAAGTPSTRSYGELLLPRHDGEICADATDCNRFCVASRRSVNPHFRKRGGPINLSGRKQPALHLSTCLLAACLLIPCVAGASELPVKPASLAVGSKPAAPAAGRMADSEAIWRLAASRDVPSFDVGRLWRLTSVTGATSYLLGTLHIGAGPELTLPPETWPMLKQARRLVVEVALDDLPPRKLEILQRMPAGERWDLDWHATDLAHLRSRLLQVGWIDPEPGQMRPWVLVNALLVGPDVPSQSLDERLIQEARASKLPVQALETAAEQFAIFDCIGLDGQLHLLRDAVRTPADKFRKLNVETIRLYASGKLADLVALQSDAFPSSDEARRADEELTRCGIDTRNERFLVQLDALLLEPGQFVAVGAAHLVGEWGLLQRLHDRGFLVEHIAGERTAIGP